MMMRPACVLLLTAMTVLASPRPADACGHGIERVVKADPVVQSVGKAERLLAAGAYRAAVQEVLSTFPEALQADHRDRRQSLFERGQRVVALATVRSAGGVPLGAAMAGRAPAKQQARLAWAAVILRLHNARDGGVLVTSELAEALAQRPAERAQARTLLAELGDLDLLPTARAWALLSTLEREHGDATAADRATRRCLEIAPTNGPCAATPTT
jgi:hypothetical protein